MRKEEKREGEGVCTELEWLWGEEVEEEVRPRRREKGEVLGECVLICNLLR